MSTSGPGNGHHENRAAIPLWLGACLFLATALFLLWEKHRAHILGALPYLLLACPVVHMFMHRGHGQQREPQWLSTR